LLKSIIVAALALGSTRAFAQPETEIDAEEAPPEPFAMSLPMLCPEGHDCWITNYPDQDQSHSAKDYKCGTLSTDGQQNTDFSVGSKLAIRAGIPIYAVAPGVVLGARNNMDDNFRAKGKVTVPPKQHCGNGILIEHQDGWRTQYCHLRKGSVTVKREEEVVEGQKLGLMGLSGDTDHPHLEFTLRQENVPIDPFTGTAMPDSCGAKGGSLWKSPEDPLLTYISASIVGGGFSDKRPQKIGSASDERDIRIFSRQSGSMYLWADVSGLRPDDQLEFEVFGPEGDQALEHTNNIKRLEFRKRAYVEFRKRSIIWPSGQYRGLVTLRRRLNGHFKEYSIERFFEMR
jgi:hypothetical protein